jgi:PAS domain S-box-containing protein
MSHLPDREPLSQDLRRLFGDDQDPMARVVERAAAMYPGATPIVWECNPQTFGFSFVSDAAVALLGYDLSLWLQPGFWAEKIVHDDDRDDAVAYCALATAKKCDHMFEYRALAADGRIVWLRDFVKIVRSADGRAASLRGVMFDITPEKIAHPTPAARIPSRDDLAA